METWNYQLIVVRIARFFGHRFGENRGFPLRAHQNLCVIPAIFEFPTKTSSLIPANSSPSILPSTAKTAGTSDNAACSRDTTSIPAGVRKHPANSTSYRGSLTQNRLVPAGIEIDRLPADDRRTAGVEIGETMETT